jgi:hypothetical protein
VNEQTPIRDANTPPDGPRDWREQRRTDRLARRSARWERHGRRPYGWLGGGVLILLGVILLVQNVGGLVLMNWWALFILIPAFVAYAGAWEAYRAAGRFTRAAASSLVAAILLTALSMLLLFSITLGAFWPVLLIVGGLALLAAALVPA